MNIEEERKAFLENMKPKLIADFGCGCLAEGYDKDTFDHPGVQFTFEGWLAAKSHSEEMAKPHCRVTKDGIGWWLYRFGEISAGPYKSAEDAKVWAQANGYRVIE